MTAGDHVHEHNYHSCASSKRGSQVSRKRVQPSVSTGAEGASKARHKYATPSPSQPHHQREGEREGGREFLKQAGKRNKLERGKILCTSSDAIRWHPGHMCSDPKTSESGVGIAAMNSYSYSIAIAIIGIAAIARNSNPVVAGKAPKVYMDHSVYMAHEYFLNEHIYTLLSIL